MAPSAASRRERPAKPALSREWIVAETIGIMRDVGLEKATMRRVAQALDTGPASLYVYVANTAELHSAVLDELLGTLLGALPDAAPSESSAGEWQSRLEALLRGYAGILFEHPGLARSALLLRPTGPNAVLLYDRMLGLLLEGDVAVDRAAWGVDLLLQYVTGIAAEHSTPQADGTPTDSAAGMSELAKALHGADPEAAPHLAAHVDAVLSGEPEQRLTWALRALIAGIAATPTPVTGEA
ncbi:TetR/AcrR family transcriptional regulator [Herbiconiux sp. VKM Ac-2851]|uniref:TetR/AcrR family transcriptional regulator n=1 Tax=Herbiconiux sp. VKM Ac-2851 TaxID=2739025 RepID=UPI001566C943|nr:TetR/AcrR family transcriptional regulator [Herbiconiux sp. VKM Ac-2851]NQX34525.1 TetR/AcrR family transcriptional regulator [Herbiconiux sp. VKM Ac-2851]